ncbi:hypothetical protein PMZ80_009629 [Knufia obscura]|uniref:Uncharacterized protein n=1 Tax=Knufia obscura TaxID=1635080 RepID=A0ABR0RBN4_9EURO|nr:hypothetical protein PMZ80_009629 [Knufia obscura]
MPVRWDNDARYTLLLMILSQNPSVLSSKIDAAAISASWPRNEDLTVRAVQEQVKFFRKEIAKIGSGKPISTPSPSGGRGLSTPRKVSTPASVTPSKRPNGSSIAKTPSSSAKKRKVSSKKSTKDTDDSDAPSLPSSDEEEAPTNDTDEDSPLSKLPTTTERRTLPARSKSRSRSYVEPSDSEGRGAGAQETDDGDSEFSISKMSEEGRLKGRTATATLLRKLIAGNCDGEGEGDGVEDRDASRDTDVKMEKDSDVESGVTRRTSWKSAQEEI